MSKICLIISLFLCGCAGNKSQQPPIGESTKQETQTTMAQWIEKANAKKEKCEGDGWAGGGSNGFDYWDERCIDGVVVFKDTTKENLEELDKEQRRKIDLINAARTRLLTKEEMQEVLAYGPYIFTAPMQQFYQDDIDKRFGELMLQQAREAAVGR